MVRRERQAAIETAAQGLKLIVTEGGVDREFLVSAPSLVLGRALSNEVVLADPKASRAHARLDWSGGACRISDLQSTNGTWVNGQRIGTATDLTAGDTVTIGETTVRLAFETAAEVAEEPLSESAEDMMRTMIAQPTIAVAVNDTSKPRLAIQALGDTWEVEIGANGLIIGRNPSSDVVIDSEQVSRTHAAIERVNEGYLLIDRRSTNGTFVRGRRVEEHLLQDGDLITVGPAQIVFKDAFAAADLQNETRIGIPTGLPTVIFVPGIMGSELWSGDECIWPNLRTFMNRGVAMKYPSSQPVEARGLVNQVVLLPGLFKMDIYGRLGDYLVDGLGYERGSDLFEFAYDWRQDNRESAKQLAAAIERWNIKGPIVIVAHSMGCLISRYYIEKLGGRRRISRLLQLGGPLRGSGKSIYSLVTGRGIVPIGPLADDMRRTLATFPSMYQLLPSIDCVFEADGTPVNVLEDESWVADEFRPLLRSARDFKKELPPTSSVSTVCIFGYGLKTIARIQLQRDSERRWQHLSLAREASGDTVVPESSAVLQGAEIHPVRQPHGTLFLDNDVKMRLKLELSKPIV